MVAHRLLARPGTHPSLQHSITPPLISPPPSPPQPRALRPLSLPGTLVKIYMLIHHHGDQCFWALSVCLRLLTAWKGPPAAVTAARPLLSFAPSLSLFLALSFTPLSLSLSLTICLFYLSGFLLLHPLSLRTQSVVHIQSVSHSICVITITLSTSPPFVLIW